MSYEIEQVRQARNRIVDGNEAPIDRVAFLQSVTAATRNSTNCIDIMRVLRTPVLRVQRKVDKGFEGKASLSDRKLLLDTFEEVKRYFLEEKMVIKEVLSPEDLTLNALADLKDSIEAVDAIRVTKKGIPYEIDLFIRQMDRALSRMTKSYEEKGSFANETLEFSFFNKPVNDKVFDQLDNTQGKVLSMLLEHSLFETAPKDSLLPEELIDCIKKDEGLTHRYLMPLYTKQFQKVSLKKLNDEQDPETFCYDALKFCTAIPRDNALWSNMRLDLFLNFPVQELRNITDRNPKEYDVFSRKLLSFNKWMVNQFFLPSCLDIKSNPQFDKAFGKLLQTFRPFELKRLGIGLYLGAIDDEQKDKVLYDSFIPEFAGKAHSLEDALSKYMRPSYLTSNFSTHSEVLSTYFYENFEKIAANSKKRFGDTTQLDEMLSYMHGVFDFTKKGNEYSGKLVNNMADVSDDLSRDIALAKEQCIDGKWEYESMFSNREKNNSIEDTVKITLAETTGLYKIGFNKIEISFDPEKKQHYFFFGHGDFNEETAEEIIDYIILCVLDNEGKVNHMFPSFPENEDLFETFKKTAMQLFSIHYSSYLTAQELIEKQEKEKKVHEPLTSAKANTLFMRLITYEKNGVNDSSDKNYEGDLL